MACLLEGKYVLTSAASVAKDMLRSFPSIRIGLLVPRDSEACFNLVNVLLSLLKLS